MKLFMYIFVWWVSVSCLGLLGVLAISCITPAATCQGPFPSEHHQRGEVVRYNATGKLVLITTVYGGDNITRFDLCSDRKYRWYDVLMQSGKTTLVNWTEVTPI